MDAEYVMNRLLDFKDVFEEWECTGSKEECAVCPFNQVVYESAEDLGKRTVCDMLIDICNTIEEEDE